MGFRDQREAQQAKIDALERRVAELEGELAGDEQPPQPSPAGEDPPAESHSFQRTSLLTRWIVVAVVLAGGPAIRGCASEPLALPALSVACPTAETLTTDTRSSGMSPTAHGGYSETIEVSWTCDGAEAGVLRSFAGSAGWGLLAGAAFLLLLAGMRLLPRAAWPLTALLSLGLAATHAWSSWALDAAVGDWARAGPESWMVWGAAIGAAAAAGATAELTAPEGSDPSYGYLVGLLFLAVGVFACVIMLNVLLALAAVVLVAKDDSFPVPARVMLAGVGPALIVVPWMV